MGISLYRQYRPRKFSEVAGQPAAVDVILKSLERSRTGHAYLFSGPRGCGKTTVARLLAKALNCLSPAKDCEPCCECVNCLGIAAGESLDVIEIDGASNNSVDEVRELKSHITLAPFASKYKIYIIDEVHMLSISAFNALLKTLEEPPAHVVFILATTEAHKVPVTIRSRCQHIPFHRIDPKTIFERLTQVCAGESVEFQPEALWEIARQADGALRDGLSILEQVSNLGGDGISLTGVEATLGQGSRSSLERWFASWRDGDMETFSELDRMLAGGASPQRFLEELFSLVRNLWLVARWSGVLNTLDISEQEKEYLKKEAPLWGAGELASVMRFLAEMLPQARLGLRADVLSGLLMAKMANLKEEPSDTPPAPPREKSPVPPRASRTVPAEDVPVRAIAEPSGSGRKEKAPDLEKTAKSEPAPVPQAENTEKAPEKADAPALSDSSTWEPFSGDQWNDTMNQLRENEFLLYCALMETRPFVDEKRLILDMPFRYGYEVLRLDRNRMALKKFLAQIRPDGSIVIRHGDRMTALESAARRSGEGGDGKTSTPDSPYDPESVPPDAPDGKEEESRVGGIPFEGMVRGVTRWMRGEVILVRQGIDDDDGPMIEE